MTQDDLIKWKFNSLASKQLTAKGLTPDMLTFIYALVNDFSGTLASVNTEIITATKTTLANIAKSQTNLTATLTAAQSLDTSTLQPVSATPIVATPVSPATPAPAIK